MALKNVVVFKSDESVASSTCDVSLLPALLNLTGVAIISSSVGNAVSGICGQNRDCYH